LLERFFERKHQIIRVERAYLPDLTEYFVSKKTLLRLSKHRQLVETPGDFHIILEDTIFTWVKPNGIPKILQVNALEIHPDSVGITIHLNREDLFQLANTHRITVIETDHEFVIPLGPMTYIAKKGEA